MPALSIASECGPPTNKTNLAESARFGVSVSLIVTSDMMSIEFERHNIAFPAERPSSLTHFGLSGRAAASCCVVLFQMVVTTESFIEAISIDTPITRLPSETVRDSESLSGTE